jgi:hypothetical protein
MTNKQNQQQEIQSEDDYPELLLRRFKKMDSIVEAARAMNRKNGLDESLQDQYIQYDGDFIQRSKYNKWLAAVRSNQNGHFWQMATLKMAGLISDEPSPLDEKTYPYRVLNHLYRVKTPKAEFLWRKEYWTGLDSSGEEYAISVPDLDYYVHPKIVSLDIDSTNDDAPRKRRDQDGNTSGKKIRINKISTNRMFSGGDPTGDRIWTLPFSEDAVRTAIAYASGPFSDPYNGCSLAFLKLNPSGINNPISVENLEEFLTPDFDVYWNARHAPQPTIKIDYKTLSSHMQSVDKSQYQ